MKRFFTFHKEISEFLNDLIRPKSLVSNIRIPFLSFILSGFQDMFDEDLILVLEAISFQCC